MVCYMVFALTHGNDQRSQIIESQQAIKKTTEQIRADQARIRGEVRSTREEVTTAVASAPPVIVAARTYTPAPQRSSSPRRTPLPDVLVPVAGPKSGVLVGMVVDKSQASPGETLEYHIALKNAGKVRVDVRIMSHVPFGTAFISSDSCPPAATIDTCLFMRGQHGQTGHHQIRYSAHIDPGKTNVYSFDVQINPQTEPGYVVTNHAHARGPRTNLVTSEEVRSTVRMKEDP